MTLLHKIKNFSKNLLNPNVFQRYFDQVSFTKYLFFLICFQLLAYYFSYKNLFTYLGCTENITRYFIVHDFYFELNYPKMCDEQYYFYGFEFLDKIYQADYVYQDRPLYLLFGFLIYKFLYLFNSLLQIETTSLLLLTSLIIQILLVNLIALLMVKLINKKFNRFYFILFFLITLFSFEERFYFFLPSSANIYFLIFLFSIYSIKNNKLNGFIYGLLFTASGYGIIGFLYQLLFKILYFKKNINSILTNILFFFIPTFSFEFFRLLLGYFKGSEYGVKYIYNSEVYNQFVWFLKTIFISGYSSDLECQSIPEFIYCYFSQTKFFFSAQIFYLLILFPMIALLKNRSNFYDEVKPILAFTFFSYLFISFQGLDAFRFVFYSFGFCFIILTCHLVKYLHSDLLASLFVTLYSFYTISRNDWPQFNLIFSPSEYVLIVLILIVVFFNFKTKKSLTTP